MTQTKLTPPPPRPAFLCLLSGESRNNSSRVYKLCEVWTRQLPRRATASKCSGQQVNQAMPPPVSATCDVMDKPQQTFFAVTFKGENSRGFPEQHRHLRHRSRHRASTEQQGARVLHPRWFDRY